MPPQASHETGATRSSDRRARRMRRTDPPSRPIGSTGTGRPGLRLPSAGGPMTSAVLAGILVAVTVPTLSTLAASGPEQIVGTNTAHRLPAGVSVIRPPAGAAVAATAAPAAPTASTGGPAQLAPSSATTAGGGAGIPAPVLAAYQSAAAGIAATRPGCHLSWPVLAGIGRIESGHAEGGRVDGTGRTLGRIVGVSLNGAPGVATITDTDQGTLDGDSTWDRAVGPMQFIPSTWRATEVDGNGDGTADPNNVYDAAATAASYLCRGGGDLSTSSGLTTAILGYNNSAAYVQNVLSWARTYAAGAVAVAPLPGPVPAAPVPSPLSPGSLTGPPATNAAAATAPDPVPATTTPVTTPVPTATTTPATTPATTQPPAVAAPSPGPAAPGPTTSLLPALTGSVAPGPTPPAAAPGVTVTTTPAPSGAVPPAPAPALPLLPLRLPLPLGVPLL